MNFVDLKDTIINKQEQIRQQEANVKAKQLQSECTALWGKLSTAFTNADAIYLRDNLIHIAPATITRDLYSKQALQDCTQKLVTQMGFPADTTIHNINGSLIVCYNISN